MTHADITLALHALTSCRTAFTIARLDAVTRQSPAHRRPPGARPPARRHHLRRHRRSRPAHLLRASRHGRLMTRDNLDAAIEILESVRAHLHDADIGAACAAQRLADTPAFDHTRVLLQALGAASAVCDWLLFTARDLRRGTHG